MKKALALILAAVIVANTTSVNAVPDTRSKTKAAVTKTDVKDTDAKAVSEAVAKLNSSNTALEKSLAELATLHKSVAAKKEATDLQAKIDAALKASEKADVKTDNEKLAKLNEFATKLTDEEVKAEEEKYTKTIEEQTKDRNAARAKLPLMDVVSEHPYITVATVTSVVLVLAAIYNRKALSKAAVKAAAWMKAHPAASMSIIAAVILISGASFVYANAQEGNNVWENTKHAGNIAFDGIKAIPSNIQNGGSAVYEWSKENKFAAGAITVGTIVALAVTIDLSREESALKNLVSSIYSNATSKTVVA